MYNDMAYGSFILGCRQHEQSYPVRVAGIDIIAAINMELDGTFHASHNGYFKKLIERRHAICAHIVVSVTCQRSDSLHSCRLQRIINNNHIFSILQ